jgi:hypothetical protein
MLRNQGEDRKTFAKSIKGRFIGIIIPNIIRAEDKYYKKFYDIKKEFYLERPDMLFKYADKKGLRGRCHKMGGRFLMGILVSHAFELMLMDEDETGAPDAKQRLAELRMVETRRRGAPEIPVGAPGIEPDSRVQPTELAPERWHDKFAWNHRVPIPIKPTDPSKWFKIQEDFARFHAEFLEMLKKLWVEDIEMGDPLHRRYYRFLNFGKLD